MINVFGVIWLKQGIDEAEIKNRFLQLGFTGHRIDSYFYLANMPKS
jgi:hypothetical protein